jgi:hypothetical protein
MARAPGTLTLARNRNSAGRTELVFRRISVLALTALLVAGLANAFGQRPSSTRVAAAAADLEVTLPKRLRSGLIFESRITITARRSVEDARLVLDSGWTEGMTINTMDPSPLGQASDDGKLALELGHVPAGEKYVLWLQMQVNPTTVGHRSADVELDDGARRIAVVERTITVFP